MKRKVKKVEDETHHDRITFQVLNHLRCVIPLPSPHIFGKKKGPPNDISYLSAPNVLAFPNGVILVYRSAIHIEFIGPWCWRIFLMFTFVRSMTYGLLGSSAIFTFSFFGWRLGHREFGLRQCLLCLRFLNFLLPCLPLFHNRPPLRESGSRRITRSFRRLWGKRPKHGPYVDGPLLNRHIFTCTWNGVENSGKNRDSGQ
jgi:hypothetical protein